MQLEQRIATKHMQTMRLSAQMVEALEMLALPALDLQQRINRELETNPALERVADGEDAVSLEESFEEFDNIEYDHTESEWDSVTVTAKKELNTIIERTASSAEGNLRDTLLDQLRLQPIDKSKYACGHEIIRNLDENGFHIIDPDRHPILGQNRDTAAMVSLIQTFEPWGICVHNVQESLILQAALHGNAPVHTKRILQEHFVALEKRKYDAIAQALAIPRAAVEQVYNYIRTLTPYPGRTIHAQRVQYIVPDLEIVFRDNRYHIAVNQHSYPRLSINKLFLTLDADTDRDSSQFIKSYRQQAKSFIASLKRRNQTLLRTAYALLHYQHRFFRFGPRYVQPLRLQDVATILHVHETTVSRIAARKYVQTNWGVYPISFLFSTPIVSNAEDAPYSKESVKALVKDIIDAHGNDNSLSDQQIANQLQEKGIRIARRTVTKYRHELRIPNATYRAYRPH